MTPRLVLLGTGTCRLEPARAASAVLIELPDSRLVFDFGRGIAHRLVELGLRQDDVLEIVLSHFHPDHLSDLVPFVHAGLYSPTDARTRDLRIHGPAGVGAVVQDLLQIVGFPEAGEAAFRVRAREIEGRADVGGARVEFLPLPPAGNHGLRFSHLARTYALTGDSHFHEQEIEFLRDADLAIVDSGHLDDDDLVDLAVHSRARVLVLSHFYRALDDRELTAKARARGYEGSILAGRDGMTFAL